MDLVVLLAAALAVGGAPPAQRPFEPQSLAFWDPRHGLVSGHEVGRDGHFVRAAVWSTDDGGRTWRVVRRGIGPFEVAAVRGGRAGWLGTPWAVLSTGDRGRTWSVVSHTALRQLSFATARSGWALDRRSLLASHDGGATWRRFPQPCGPLFRYFGAALALASPQHGWILCLDQPGTGGQGKRVLETTDGGETWRLRARARPSGRDVGNLTLGGYGLGLSFLPNGHGWLMESRGWFLQTRDSGFHWRPLPISRPEKVEVHAAQLLDDHAGVALVSNVRRLAFTHDGGLTWRYGYRFR
jgi:photosystem II stability/assembly factor-like uncharacterized protein